MKYWLFIDEKVSGPFSLEEIHRKSSLGEVEKNVLIADSERMKWIPLSNFLFATKYEKPISTLSQKTDREFKRICRNCGKIWHSLESREKKIESRQQTEAISQVSGALLGCSTCGVFGSGTAAQASRNIAAGDTDLQRLRSCPECFSSNYSEETIDIPVET